MASLLALDSLDPEAEIKLYINCSAVREERGSAAGRSQLGWLRSPRRADAASLSPSPARPPSTNPTNNSRRARPTR